MYYYYYELEKLYTTVIILLVINAKSVNYITILISSMSSSNSEM